MYTSFEGRGGGGARDERTQFFGQIFPKSAWKRLFGPVFFQDFACGAENLAKIGQNSALGELEKSIWSN